MTGETWREAYERLQAAVRADPAFPELVRSYGGLPEAVAPSRRARRITLGICARVGMPASVYAGVAYGAAADTIRARKSGRA